MTAMRVATAQDYVEAFTGGVYGPADLEGWVINSWGGDKPSQIGLQKDGYNQRLTVETYARTGFPADFASLRQLVMKHINEIAGKQKQLRFPFDLRFERSSIRIQVDGRARTFKVVTCGEFATATAEISGSTVTMHGARNELSEIALRRLTEEDLAALLEDHRRRHGPMLEQEVKTKTRVFKNEQRHVTPAVFDSMRSVLLEQAAAKGEDPMHVYRRRLESARNVYFHSFTTEMKRSDTRDPTVRESLYVSDFIYLQFVIAAEELLKHSATMD
jgi:hypothetical protein